MLKPYLYALLAVPPKVLGKQLVPLTLGHCWILDTLNSPLIRGGQIELADILLCVIVCSMPWRHALDVLQYDRLEQRAEELGAQATELDIHSARHELVKYISYYAQAPERQNTTSTQMGVTVPWYFCLIISLFRLGFDEERAWNCEVGKALCYQAAASYMDGDKSLLSDSQIAQLERDPEDAKREARANQERALKDKRK